MFRVRINVFIFLCFFYVVFAQNHLRDILQREISENCKRSYYLRKDIQDFQMCFGADIRNLLKSDRHAFTVVHELCKTDLTECLRQLGDAVKDCLSHHLYTDIFDDPIKTIKAAQKYVCSSNGQPLKDFLTRDPHCPFDVAGLHRSETCKSKIINEDLFMETFHTEEACLERVELVTCWVDAYDKCDDAIARDFFKNLGFSMLEATSCKPYTEPLKPNEPFNLVLPSKPTTKQEPPKTLMSSDGSTSCYIANLLNVHILCLTLIALLSKCF